RGDEIALYLLQVALVLRIAHVVMRALLEMHRCDLHRYSLPVPARTSATCNTRVLLSPRRRKRPSILRIQPKSPSTTASAPLLAICWHLLSARRVEISPYLSAKVPPKPQHVSHSVISLIFKPGTFASSVRGCCLTPISRKPAQESWYVTVPVKRPGTWL